MNEDSGRPGSRFVDACVGLFIGAMALYGAVWIIKSIWIWLCVLVLVGAIVWFGVWLVVRRQRGW